MTRQTFWQNLNRTPFAGFTIRMRDGREFRIRQRDSVFFPTEWRETFFIALPNEQFERISLGDVKELDSTPEVGRVLVSVDDQPVIHDRGRGPEIVGTRITVYDVMDYHKHGDAPGEIARIFNNVATAEQIRVAIEYIESHKDEVMAEYQKMLDRCAQGNPPHIRKMLEESHQRLLKKMEELRRQKSEGEPGARTAR